MAAIAVGYPAEPYILPEPVAADENRVIAQPLKKLPGKDYSGYRVCVLCCIMIIFEPDKDRPQSFNCGL